MKKEIMDASYRSVEDQSAEASPRKMPAAAAGLELLASALPSPSPHVPALHHSDSSTANDSSEETSSDDMDEDVAGQKGFGCGQRPMHVQFASAAVSAPLPLTVSSASPPLPHLVQSQSTAQQHHLQQKAHHHKMFLVFCKCLLKYLEKTDVILQSRAKAVIADCTRRHRQDSASLQDAVETRLSALLGKLHYERAIVLYHKFVDRCRGGGAAATNATTRGGMAVPAQIAGTPQSTVTSSSLDAQNRACV